MSDPEYSCVFFVPIYLQNFDGRFDNYPHSFLTYINYKKTYVLYKNLIWKFPSLVIALWILRHGNFYPMGIYLSPSRRLIGYKLCNNHIKSTNSGKDNWWSENPIK